jgi:hypothetical protein
LNVPQTCASHGPSYRAHPRLYLRLSSVGLENERTPRARVKGCSGQRTATRLPAWFSSFFEKALVSPLTPSAKHQTTPAMALGLTVHPVVAWRAIGCGPCSCAGRPERDRARASQEVPGNRRRKTKLNQLPLLGITKHRLQRCFFRWHRIFVFAG